MTNQNNNQQPQQNPVPPPYSYYAPPQEDEINLMDLWKVIAGQKKLLFVITTITTLIALTYALLATPIYRAEALLAPVSKEKGGQLSALAGQFGGLASLAGINLGGGGGGGIEEAIATLKSREFTNKFIEDESLLSVLFDGEWDKSNKKWSDVKKQPTLWRAYKKFKSIRTVSQDNKTGLITLSIDWKDPVLAASWVGKLIKRLNDQLRQEAIMKSKKSILFLEAEIQKTSVIEIKEAIYSLIEAQTKTKMLANTQEEYAFRVLDEAVVPEEKVKPKRRLIVVLGFILGVMISILLVFIRQVFISKK